MMVASATAASDLSLQVLDAEGAGESAPRPVDPAPATNAGFSEKGEYRFFVPPGGPWRFHVDDLPLKKTDAEAGASWEWTPGFYAGEVTAELIGPSGRPVSQYLLDVSPHLGKLGRDIFRKMLEEVWAADPALVLGEEPATTDVGARGDRDNSLIRFARMRRYGAGLLRALERVTRNPIRNLRTRRELVPAHRVRRVDRRTAQAVLRSRELLAVLTGQAATAEALTDPLDVPVTESHLDCPDLKGC